MVPTGQCPGRRPSLAAFRQFFLHRDSIQTNDITKKERIENCVCRILYTICKFTWHSTFTSGFLQQQLIWSHIRSPTWLLLKERVKEGQKNLVTKICGAINSFAQTLEIRSALLFQNIAFRSAFYFVTFFFLFWLLCCEM